MNYFYIITVDLIWIILVRHNINDLQFRPVWLMYEVIFSSKKLNSVALSPQANYTDRATATCRQLLRIEGVA
jgi:hypothetical protein